MELISEYGMFLARVLTLIAAVLVVVFVTVAAVRSGKSDDNKPDDLEVRHLNAGYDRAALRLRGAMLPARQFKAALKADKARRKARAGQPRPRTFVLDFQGDLRATAVDSLREEITALLSVAGKDDQVLLRLESAGGLVHSYGLAAAQLLRIRDHDIPLTVAVDKVAASGGYMMACVANRILASPFAIVGSVGVIAQLPNFNRLLKKHDIDYEQFMAGEHKRTVTLFGENTDPGREKFQQEIEQAHTLFKAFIKAHRPQVDLELVATGEHWFGADAIKHQLVDELTTSDEYLLKSSAEADLYLVKRRVKKPLLARLLSQDSQSRLW